MKKFTFLIFAIAAMLTSGSVFGQISFRSASSTTGTTTSITVTKPAGVVANDVMIAVLAAQGTTADATAPSGWTLIDGADLAGGTDRNGTVFYKVAGGSEPANYTFTLGAGASNVAASISAFYNVDAASPFDVASGSITVNGSSTTVTAAGKTTVSANAAVVMCAMSAGRTGTHSAWTTATSPGALTEVSDQGQGNGTDGASVGTAWAIKATAGATGNATCTLSDGERSGGILLVLKPISVPGATLTPAANQNIAVGGAINFTATATGAYTGSGNYTFTWTAAGATGLGTNPVSQAGTANAKSLTYNTAGTYSVTVSISRGTTVIATNTVTVNVFAAPSAPNMWATSSDGNMVSSFSVNGGIDFGAGPTNLFDPFPSSTSTTAALGRTDKPSQANGYFYWLPNTGTNAGVVSVYGATAVGGSQTLIGTLDLNGAGSSTDLGFVRLGFGPDGTGYILAGSGTTLYLAKFKPNGVTVNASLPAADQLVVVDASVSLSGGTVATFQNGDVCVAGDGNLVALANDGVGVTQIFTGPVNGSSTLLTKKFDVLDNVGAPFTGSVNGVAFDVQGSLYVSTSSGLYYIDKNTVNGPASTINISLVWSGSGLQDLASNFFPTTIITPVTLGSFDVVKAGNNALVTWKTLTEANTNYFVVERSTDGINFVTAGTVQASGSTTTAVNYQFVDAIPSGAKVIYYRLKTVDVDAKSSLSKIIALRLNGSVGAFKIYPNPFTSDLKIQISSEKETAVTVRISNALGQSVVNRKAILQSGENILVLTTELATLKSGMYVLEIISAEGKISEKIIKK